MAFVGLTRRAVLDLRELEQYSEARWGKRVADLYLESIEQALNMLRKDPRLLRSKAGISEYFSFYRVREHFLVCTVNKKRVYVLTIKHGSMDLPVRLAELEPQLFREVEQLHRALAKKR